MTFQQRIFLALAMCAAILFGYDLLMPKPPPPEPGEEDAKVAADGKSGDPSAESNGSADGATDSAAEPEVVTDPSVPTYEIETHEVRNELLAVSLTNRSPGRDGVHELVVCHAHGCWRCLGNHPPPPRFTQLGRQ